MSQHVNHDAPFSQPETFTAEVRDLSSEGLGVVDHPAGKVIFVSGTWPGDRGVFQVTKEEKRYGYGKLLELTHASTDRVTPPCSHLGFGDNQCGGCPWMIANYDSQLKAKQKRLEFLLTRNQLLSSNTQVRPIVASEEIFAYRNRAQFKTDGTRLGYVSPGTKKIVDIEGCQILTPHNQQTLQELRAQLPNPKWQPGEGYLWNFIDLDESVRSDQITLNKRLPFRQGNSGQNQKMRAWLRDRLGSLSTEKGVIELFAGSGNFTSVFIEAGVGHVHCAEINRHAVDILNQKGLPGVQGFVMDLYRPARWRDLPPEIRQSHVLFLDPPREGFKYLAQFVQKLPRLSQIVYVSCEPHQWSLDIKPLLKKGWQLKEVQPLDLFPHTPHLEALSLLIKA